MQVLNACKHCYLAQRWNYSLTTRVLKAELARNGRCLILTVEVRKVMRKVTSVRPLSRKALKTEVSFFRSVRALVQSLKKPS